MLISCAAGCSPTSFCIKSCLLLQAAFVFLAAEGDFARSEEVLPEWNPVGVLQEFKSPTIGSTGYIEVEAPGIEHPLTMLIDTGATTTIIDSKYSKSFAKSGDVLRVRSADGNKTIVEKLTPVPLRSKGFTFLASDEMVGIDLSPASKILGRRLDGVIGTNCLSKNVVHFDWDNQRVLICDADKPLNPPGTELPLYLRESGPTIKVKMPGGRSQEFLCDTGGFHNVSIEESIYDSLITQRKYGLRPGRERNSIDGFGHKVSRSSGVFPSLVLAGVEHENIVVGRSAVTSIGVFFLMRYRVTLNFRDKKCFLLPSRLCGMEDVTDFDGTTFSLGQNGEKVFTSVVRDGVGYAAGIREGDELVKIRDTTIQKYSLVDTQCLWIVSRTMPSAIQLSIKREGGIKNITLNNLTLHP